VTKESRKYWERVTHLKVVVCCTILELMEVKRYEPSETAQLLGVNAWIVCWSLSSRRARLACTASAGAASKPRRP
jgi:hypothetical protein